MMKMLIELDREKVEREEKYDYEEMQSYIDGLFSDKQIFKNDKGIYDDIAFSSIISIIMLLAETEWFMENAKKWLLYEYEPDWEDEDREDIPADEEFSIEDLLKLFRNEKTEDHNLNRKRWKIDLELDIASLEKHYSKSNPKKAYKEIEEFLVEKGFENRPELGYASKSKKHLSNGEMLKLTLEIYKVMPWLEECLTKFTIEEIGKIWDIKKFWKEGIWEESDNSTL